MYYRIPQPADGLRPQLLTFLQRVFEGEAAFVEDARKLKKAIQNGSCTASEWRPFSGLSGHPRTVGGQVS